MDMTGRCMSQEHACQRSAELELWGRFRKPTKTAEVGFAAPTGLSSPPAEAARAIKTADVGFAMATRYICPQKNPSRTASCWSHTKTQAFIHECSFNTKRIGIL